MLARVSEAGQSERPPVSEETMRRIGRAGGEVATASLAAMSARLPWFHRLTADQRAGVALVTQRGAANFVEWLRAPEASPRLTADAFRNAPLDLARRVTLRQTVELVRVAIEVFEQRIPTHAATPAERARLVHAVLAFGREVAFSAASVYASAAESRGAWDARLEALLVDAVVRGDAEESGASEASLFSRASALGWEPAAPATVIVGDPPDEEPPDPLHAVRRVAHRAGASVLLGVHGARLVMILAGVDIDTGGLTAGFGPGPVVVGPTVEGLGRAHQSAVHALAGHRAVAAWPGAPRPVPARALLPERVLAGDEAAVAQMLADVAAPLRAAAGSLAETVESYLDHGGVLEACARTLFVHPNTVRYRLRRVAEITGHHAGDARGAMSLRMALALGRLRDAASPPTAP